MKKYIMINNRQIHSLGPSSSGDTVIIWSQYLKT